MKFFNGFASRTEAALRPSNSPDTFELMDETMEDTDEITDETLLEAIVGTGAPGCQEVTGMARTPASNNSQSRYKHR